MPFRLTWTVYGDQLVREEFSRFTAGVQDFRPVFEQLQNDLQYRLVQQGFTSRGARFGSTWPALSPKYAEWKARHYPGRPMMVLTRRLERSLLGKTGDSIRVLGKKVFRFGTRVPYGIFHHMGTTRMPRRQFLGLTHDDKVAWGKIVHKYCVGLMGRLRYSR